MTGTMSRFRMYAPGTIAAAVWLGLAVTQTVSAQTARMIGSDANPAAAKARPMT